MCAARRRCRPLRNIGDRPVTPTAANLVPHQGRRRPPAPDAGQLLHLQVAAPSPVSHMKRLPSFPPAARVRPSGDRANTVQPDFPVETVRRRLPVWTSHWLTNPSSGISGEHRLAVRGEDEGRHRSWSSTRRLCAGHHGFLATEAVGRPATGWSATAADRPAPCRRARCRASRRRRYLLRSRANALSGGDVPQYVVCADFERGEKTPVRREGRAELIDFGIVYRPDGLSTPATVPDLIHLDLASVLGVGEACCDRAAIR